jgi:uncharacterized protein (DUF3084 family)
VSVLWIAPLVFLAVGALLITATLGKSADATAELRDECAQLEDLRSALSALRQEADSARATVDRIRSRSDRSPVDR